MRTKEQLAAYNAEYYRKNKEKIIANVQAYTQANRTAILERKKTYRENHKGEMKAWRRKNHEKIIEYNQKWFDANPYEKRKWYSYRSGAHQRGIEWNLSFDDFAAIILGDCFYCGAVGGSVDRVDSTKDYSISNVVPSCRPCNRMKSDFGRDFFIKKCIEVAKLHG